jgi:uncharacterized protein
MRMIFADTFYWIALANPKDHWHQTALRSSRELHPFLIMTTDEVLVEFLAFLGGRGKLMRQAAVALVRKIHSNPNIIVLPQSRESFERGLELYAERSDKEYSMTDCISMASMRLRNVTDVLSHDHHFTQEGFVILMTEMDP